MSKITYYKPGSSEVHTIPEGLTRTKDIVKELKDQGYIVVDKRDEATRAVDDYIRTFCSR